jgi:hypothetical protein
MTQVFDHAAPGPQGPGVFLSAMERLGRPQGQAAIRAAGVPPSSSLRPAWSLFATRPQGPQAHA